MIRRNLENALSRAMLRAPVEKLYGSSIHSPGTTIDGERLDPKTRYVLSLLALAGPPPPETVSPEVARAQYLERGAAVAPSRRRLSRVAGLSMRTSSATIPGRIYVPRQARSRSPALVYYHGGGWVLGNLDTHDRLCRVLADDAACIVVSVDYRLAPEHKFPAAAEDAMAAFSWVVENAESLGIDRGRIAVGGDSAGGNLAAIVGLAAASGSCPAPVYQLLIYPVTDLACASTSYDRFADGYFLTRSLMLWFRAHYLPTLDAIHDPMASPLRAELRTPVSPALVVTAGFDPLLDEGSAYAHKLRSGGTEVTYRCHEGLIHGFASMTGVIPAAASAVAEAATALRLVFARL